MKHTLARKAFKHQLGQANHFLVTTLVALDCLDKNPRHMAAGLHAAWSPKSVPNSIQRSRIFILHSFLGTAVDALDVYFSLLNRKPDFIQDASFSQALQACGRSVHRKATAFASWVPGIVVESALVELLITWRNNVMHELADNLVSDSSKVTLKTHAHEIAQSYRGLNPESLVEKAETGADLTFKETASLIGASHNFVAAIDGYVLAKLDIPDFYITVLREWLFENAENQGFRTRLFDTRSDRWDNFMSNWAGNTLHASPLSKADLDSIKKRVPSLK